MGAYINGDYKSEYSGDQIDAAIGKVRTPDSTPTASSDNLVTSGGVKAALDQKQAVINDLSTIRQGASDGSAALTATNEIEQVMAQGYKYYGVATPSTNPGTLEQKVFYIASQPGTYTNLGGIVVNDGEVCTLMWNENSWSKQVTGAATAAQVSQLGQKVNTKVFTNGKGGANNVIRLFFLDTSGYTGTTPLTGLRIRTLSNGWGGLWGFSLENGDGTLIGAPWRTTNESIMTGTNNGIYYYGIFNWDNMVSVDHINTIELTNECYKEYNDPRIVNLPDGSVTTAKLANGAVTTPKLANGAVNDEKADGRLLESKFINAIGRYQYDITQIVLNAYLNLNGNPDGLNGWGYVRFIPLIPNTTITMGANTLGYVIKYRALYDKNKQFIAGSFGALGGATTINCDAIIASNPTAKYIGIDLIDPSESGSGTIVLTPTNTEDWIINIKSKYVDEIKDLDNRVTALENGGGVEKKNTFVFSSGESSIISPFDATNNFKLGFRITRAVDNTQNPCFNFVSAKLVNKSTSAETLVHSCSDDICPGNYNGTYIGANHGQDATTVTAANHGKTFADIGSKWTDGTHNFYIVAIVSANEIQMLSDNQSTYPLWSFIMPSVGTLTHVSGATHTGDITITARTTSQMRPIMTLQSTKIVADGEEITQTGTYHFNKLKISQIYDVRNSASVLNQLISRVGQFTANPIFSQLGADKVMRHSITYEFDSAQECTVTTDFLAYQNVSLSYFGFTQQGVLSGDNVKMYIPKTLPISNGQTTLDFRTIAPHNSVPSTMNITTQYWENAQLPPDRWIQFADNISFVGGYLFDKGVGGNERKNVINNAFFLYTSRKCYPHGIDSKITLSGGQSFSAVNIRKYIPAVSGSIPPYVFTTFEYNGELYVYFDAWSTGIHSVSIPDKFINGALTIFEKSANVDILSSTVNSEMLVRVTSATPMYGYLVGKITI